MKTIVMYLLVMISCMFLTSCYHDTIHAKGEVTETEYSFTNYSELKVSDDFNVYIRFSETEEKIVVEANSDIQDKIVVKKEGDALVARLQRNISIRGNATMNLYITTNHISRFYGAGDINFFLENELIADDMLIDLSGDSEFRGELQANTLDIDLDGDSDINIFGAVATVKANLSGDSNLRDYDLAVRDLDIELSGDSDAFLFVSEAIKIDASGDSSLNYKGNATVLEKRLTGDSRLHQVD